MGTVVLRRSGPLLHRRYEHLVPLGFDDKSFHEGGLRVCFECESNQWTKADADGQRIEITSLSPSPSG